MAQELGAYIVRFFTQNIAILEGWEGGEPAKSFSERGECD